MEDNTNAPGAKCDRVGKHIQEVYRQTGRPNCLINGWIPDFFLLSEHLSFFGRYQYIKRSSKIYLIVASMITLALRR